MQSLRVQRVTVYYADTAPSYKNEVEYLQQPVAPQTSTYLFFLPSSSSEMGSYMSQAGLKLAV